MKNDLFDLHGRIALITGSSRGLGFVLAKGLAQYGAKVILNGRNQDAVSEATKKLKEEGFSAFGYPFDVTDKAQIQEQVTNIEREVGPIDILINNAGIQKRTPIVEVEEESWREIIDVNLTGVFLTTQRVVKSMIARRRGKIINICSLLSEVGRPTVAPYTASKGGVKMLTRAMAVEWAQHNIQVNGIGPGYFITEMNLPLAENLEFDNWLKTRTPASRWGHPEELVGTVVFLASEASDFIVGQIIYVDGGVLASL